jgi:hypothetical protein
VHRSSKRTWITRALAGAGLTFGLALAASSSSALACPDGPPGPPPPEAFTACENKARGDACTVQIHDRTVSGTYDSPPDQSRLACRPNGPPPPPPGDGNRGTARRGGLAAS